MTFVTSSLRAVGTGAFATSYNAALGNAGLGPFAIRLFNFDNTLSGDDLVKLQGTISSASTVVFTEAGAEKPITLVAGQLELPPTPTTFHLAFTKNNNPAGDLEIGGFKMSAKLDPGCGALLNVTATLFIPASQGSVTLSPGGPTIGSQLGASAANVGGLGFAGWAVALSAFDVVEVNVP